jgi:hypothetical protein
LVAAAFAFLSLLCGGGEALVGGVAGAGLCLVLAPGLGAVGAALVVAVEQCGNDGGQQLAVGALRDGVMARGRSSLAVKMVCRACAAACLVPRCIWWMPVSTPCWCWWASLLTEG